MSFLKILGLQKSDKPSEDADTVREISRKLDRLDPAVAAYHALFACILSRVAHADLVISEEETRKMEGPLQTLGHLSPEMAALAVAAADGSISGRENAEIRKIADELEIERADFIAIRSRFRDHLAVLK